MGFAETFLSKKFPAPSKISLRPHIPCASGNMLLQCLRQQIQDLLFKSIEDFVHQSLKKSNLNNITYNFVPKNAMQLHFDKSLAQAFREPQR